MEMSGAFTLHSPLSEGIPGGEKGSVIKTKQTAGEKGGGFTTWLSTQRWVFVRLLLDRKSKSSLFPGAGGRGQND